MSRKDIEWTLVIAALQKIFSLRKKLTNRVRVITGFFSSHVYIDRDGSSPRMDLYIDRGGYFIEWNEGNTERKTIKEVVSMLIDFDYKDIEKLRKEIEKIVGEVTQ